MDPSGATLGGIAGTSALALLALLGPGLAIGHAWLGLRRLTLLAAALPLTAGVVGVLTLLVPPLGLPWTATTAVVLLAVTIAAVASGVRRRRRRTSAVPRGAADPDPDLGRGDRLVTGLALVGALVVLLAVVSSGLGGLGIGQPIEHRDAIFHYSATALVASGDGSPFPLGGLDALFPGESGVYYPSLWHGLVALPALASDPVVASHVVVLVVAWSFLLGVAALARAAAPRVPYAAGLAVVVASASVAFPYYSMHFHGQWPWALSLVLTLPALVLGLRCADRPRDARAWVAFGVAGLGATLAHGSAPAVVVVGATAWGMALLARGIGRGPAPHRVGSGLAVVALPLLVAALAWIAVTTVPLLSSMGDFERISLDQRGEVTQTLQYAVPVPPLTGVQDPAWVLTALAALGLLVLVQHVRGRWIVATAVLLLVLRVLAAGPDGPLRDLTALWYKDYDRLEALLVAPMAVLAGAGGAGLVAIVRRLVARGSDGPGAGGHGSAWPQSEVTAPAVAALSLTAVTAAVVLGTGGLHAPVSAETVRQGPRQAVPDRPYSMGVGEAAWLRSLAGELPEGARVLGAPASGAVLAPALAGWDVVPRPLYPVAGDPADELLYDLERLGEDPGVCERVAELGVTHVYLDTPGHMLLGWSYPDPLSLPDGTLRTVAAHEDARLMEIAACE
ncbi:DUF6541 family protein [Georgenia sp. Z1491]|uniref:DUF6541 family protein n=1 Tax=Georgenia sp. Z1491 TaxID=3416707 RepID=UPI003CEB270D